MVFGKQKMCDIKKCKKEEEYKFLGHWICEYHWLQYCNNKINLKYKDIYKRK